MINITTSGSFAKTEAFLTRVFRSDLFVSLEGYAQKGVSALSNATPRDTGLTAESWYYTITKRNGYYSIIWRNRNLDEDQQSIAILIQYGHAKENGGYVQGRDYINPAIQPILDEIVDAGWKLVTNG